jgi:hypothetical protein
MSAEEATAAAAVPAKESWPALNLPERRVLGVLVEKQKTTPDAYPMSVNALVTGCNQKSNRDPLLNLSDMDVEEALAALQQRKLVLKITGGRVERWRHNLYDAWGVDKAEMAVIAELLLRGAQTEGELRGRVSRMEPINDLDALRAVLRPLARRGLVVYLTPEGRRGTTLTHGFHAEKELERLRAGAGSAAAESDEEAPPAPTPRVADQAEQRLVALELSLAEASHQITALRGDVTELQSHVATLTEQLRVLKEALGG